MKKHPTKWAVVRGSAMSRCTNPKQPAYRWYGKRGIKCLISSEEIRELWFRDKAYLMKHPSIDRIDSDGNYEISNCRFIEKSENIRKASRESFEKRTKAIFEKLINNRNFYHDGVKEYFKKRNYWKFFSFLKDRKVIFIPSRKISYFVY